MDCTTFLGSELRRRHRTVGLLIDVSAAASRWSCPRHGVSCADIASSSIKHFRGKNKEACSHSSVPLQLGAQKVFASPLERPMAVQLTLLIRSVRRRGSCGQVIGSAPTVSPATYGYQHRPKPDTESCKQPLQMSWHPPSQSGKVVTVLKTHTTMFSRFRYPVLGNHGISDHMGL